MKNISWKFSFQNHKTWLNTIFFLFGSAPFHLFGLHPSENNVYFSHLIYGLPYIFTYNFLCSLKFRGCLVSPNPYI